jgi:hypothetical protein
MRLTEYPWELRQADNVPARESQAMFFALARSFVL